MILFNKNVIFEECNHLAPTNEGFIAGAARRAGPDSMSILCLCICVCICVCIYVCKIISQPLIGRKSGTTRDVARRRTT